MPEVPERLPTVNDVAVTAGVSRQTVSNVINAPERVRPDTLARVQAAIDELGYRPNRVARNLQAKRTHLIGYQLFEQPDRRWVDFVLDRFLHALTDAAASRGQHVLLFSPDEDPLSRYADLFETRTVDGFALAETVYDDPRVPYLSARGIPFVTFGRTGHPEPYSHVDVDSAAGTSAAVAHLVARGHRRIAFLGWPEGSPAADQRAAGYRQGLAEAGLQPDPDHDARGVNDLSTGASALSRLLDLADPPTAIVAASDLLAAGALEAAKVRGVAVGRGFGIVGFDDSPVAPYLSPPLTTLRQPLEAVAEEVMQLLSDRIGGAPARRDGVLLEPELIVRAST